MPEDTVIFVGKKSTMAYVMAVLTQMNENGFGEITLKARGKAISRAVDVAEIVKGKLSNAVKIEGIKTHTEEIPGDGDETIKVSAIEITLKK